MQSTNKDANDPFARHQKNTQLTELQDAPDGNRHQRTDSSGNSNKITTINQETSVETVVRTSFTLTTAGMHKEEGAQGDRVTQETKAGEAKARNDSLFPKRRKQSPLLSLIY